MVTELYVFVYRIRRELVPMGEEGMGAQYMPIVKVFAAQKKMEHYALRIAERKIYEYKVCTCWIENFEREYLTP